jgi:SAM-dependent methyltransferase
VGSGRRGRAGRALESSDRDHGFRVATDVDLASLRANAWAHARVVADAGALPFRESIADLVTSRTVVEHLLNPGRFTEEVARILTKGGTTLHFLPCRYAPFAIINRTLPHRFAQALLYTLYPESREVGGYKAYYAECTPSRMSELFRRAALDVTDVEVSYYEAHYFTFCAPLYVLIALYEWFIWAFGVRELCACFILQALKPASSKNASATQSN